MGTAVPPRLFGIKARRAPVIVLIRRGPSRWSQSIRWRTDCDHFEVGQWVRAHVFGRRSDLSPHGEFLIYFAQNYARKMPTWTAISRPPYWTAVEFFPHGDSWGGGGLMVDDRHYKLNGSRGEDYPIFAERLERDGWQMEQELSRVHPVTDCHRFSLPHPTEPVSLVMNAFLGYGNSGPGVGCYYEMYDLRYADGREVAVPDAEWADWDSRGRLVYARQGQVFAAQADGSDERLLYTAVDESPEPLAAPAAALVPADLKPVEPPVVRVAKAPSGPRPKKQRSGMRKRLLR